MDKLTVNATNTVNRLKENWLQDPAMMDFHCAQVISGNHNKTLRQEIVKQLTGEVRPISQCGMYAVSDIMKASFMQYSLF